tara:strand:+ start:1816 stop:3453 length:1638 start_codon:yes stop_codon:yes gene_type:complete
MKWIGQHIWDQVSKFRQLATFEEGLSISTGKSITMDEYTSGTISITKIQDSGTTFNDNDTSLMTAAAIADKIEAYGYSTTTGDITGITVETDGDNFSDASGAVTFGIKGNVGITTALDGADITISPDSASTSARGVVELATTAETTTGTDTGRVVTPDGLKDGYQGSANVTTLGTITTGTWQGTAIGASYVATLNQNTTGQAGTVATIAGLAPDTATTQATQPHIESIGTDGDVLDVNSDAITMFNSTSNRPLVKLVNNTNDNSPPWLEFWNQRLDSGVQDQQDNDYLGIISFSGYDDGTPSIQNYARITAQVDDATSGEESGKLFFQVANHDGGLNTGLILTGGSEDTEIDTTIGNGANSVVTIPGNIDLAGDIDVDGTMEADALTVNGVAFTPSTTKSITHHMIQDDMGTTKQYIGLTESDAENTSTTNKYLPFPAPVAGKLLKVYLRSNKNLTSHTLTWRLELQGAVNFGTGPSVVGTQSGAGCNNTTMTTYDFTTGLDDAGSGGTNVIPHSNMVYLSLQSDTDFGSAVIYYMTCIWEWDLS